MNRDDIIRMAREADLDWHKHWGDDKSNRLKRFAALVEHAVLTRQKARYYQDGYEAGVAAEREACAQIAFNAKTYIEAAAAIRARG
jgi:hypothetical protein